MAVPDKEEVEVTSQDQSPNKENLIMVVNEEAVERDPRYEEVKLTGESPSTGEVEQDVDTNLEGADGLAAEDEPGSEAAWKLVSERVRSSAEPRQLELLRRFEERYSIRSSTDAFAHIPEFLGIYMVREFDYLRFCLNSGLVSEELAFDDAQWTAHMAANLTKDLVLSASLMLRLAMHIVREHNLDPADWHDVHEACKGAVRAVPVCYRVQRALPGALAIARIWKHLPAGPSDELAQAAGNPWKSDESAAAFEEMYKVTWNWAEAVGAEDKEVTGGFSGRFSVVDSTESQGIGIVSLEVLDVGPAPKGFPAKAITQGMVVMWEVEAAIGNLLEPGMRVEADFLEVHNEICFMLELDSLTEEAGVSPSWAP